MNIVANLHEDFANDDIVGIFEDSTKDDSNSVFLCFDIPEEQKHNINISLRLVKVCVWLNELRKYCTFLLVQKYTRAHWYHRLDRQADNL